jgi:hypothetical protein
LIDLIPTANSVFGLNLTSNSLALQLGDLQGQPTGGCTSQAVLVDVSPALNQVASPRRTEWTRTAILYNLLRTCDLDATEAFRSSVASANFGSLEDTPLEAEPTDLKFEVSGFEVDVAAMTFSAKALSWSNDSAADSVQVQRVGLFAGHALDRMYSFALGKPEIDTANSVSPSMQRRLRSVPLPLSTTGLRVFNFRRMGL